ncbi:hypothetical protein TWF970_001334 [Orbilia oligospora]|uniref:J domain-containing protein n=1 Tax=Orbilia oligospora TaxID=2813651 RepID=A0A7C8RBS3_ORBOL|nr:hypothetical protein TWF970_001334 [Orbilia oligospora]
MQNYYEILRVPETASPDEIRRAWKIRALEIHPDKNFGDSGATGAFQKNIVATSAKYLQYNGSFNPREASYF